MPLISTLANASARGYGIFGGVAASTNSYESIATVTVGAGGSSSISFSSIPSTYKHLQFRFMLKGSVASAALLVQYSGDTASNYNNHYLEGSGSSASAGYDATSAMYVYGSVSPSTATSVFSGGVIDLLDYQNTNKYKTSRSLTGWDANGSGYIDFDSGLWRSTSAISSALFYPTSGSFAQYSQIALYGVKG